MRIDWSPLRNELALWRRDKLYLPIWLRDDDAVEMTPALERLLDLSEHTGVPLHLAIIPARMQEALAHDLAGHSNVVPVIHGWAHANQAPGGQKKAEFGHPRAAAEDDLRRARARMKKMFPVDLLEVFVPPWNRIDPGLIPVLRALGYVGLSTFSPRQAAFPVPGLVQINTHVDPIFWRGGGGLVPPASTIARLVETLRDRRLGQTDGGEPLGILSHHLVQDDETWAFLDAIAKELLNGGAQAVTLREYV